jgi:hypothetical protein
MGFERISIKNESFSMLEMKENLLAPANETYFELSEEDSIELKIPMNELAFCLAQKNTQQAFYWIEWILEYEIRCVKRKSINLLKTKKRDKLCQNLPRFQNDIVWLIWECLESAMNKTSYYTQLFQATLKMFLFRYTTATGRRRIFFLFFLCSLVTENIDTSEKVLDPKFEEIVGKVTDNINSIYKQIKSHEKCKFGEYLHSSTKKLETTLLKLEKMQSFIPRVEETSM